MKPTAGTLLHLFLDLCSRADSVEKDVVSCAGETWTYGDLHVITSGVALAIGKRHGPRPIVALISENHPYVIVLLLAVWKLGGIIAPLDRHAPAELMEAMLRNISPTFVVTSSPDVVNQNIVNSLGIPIECIEPKTHMITALSQRFLHLSHIVPPDLYLPPQPDDVCLYIHTSSASSVSNLKCVPVTHHSIVTNGHSQLAWFQRNLPGVSLKDLRVLGWSPFSHIMSVCFDLGTSVLMTGGCYIFALTPSTYSVETRSEVDGQFDIPTLLLEAILKHQPDAFAAVPWVLDGLVHAWYAEADQAKRSRIDTALQNFKYFISAGAVTTEEGIRWAEERRLPLLISIGMTELGGVLFHSLVSEATSGWRDGDSCIDDAIFTLVDENGDVADTEGELYVASRRISRGYMNFENSAFSEDQNGYITFKTGDIYTRSSASGRLHWKGRKDDFIQLVSGESLDPRFIEGTLNACPLVRHSCVVGDMFLSSASNFVCAIIELTPEGAKDLQLSNAQITKVLGAVNRSLAPPLRIAWSRVLILNNDQQIPYTRKRIVFRKKLQALFGNQLSALLVSSNKNEVRKPIAPRHSTSKPATKGPGKAAIEKHVFDVVRYTLGLTADMLADQSQSTFAELGMDSAMAMIIINTLNQRLSLSLPANTCHTYVDIPSLTSHIFAMLQLETHTMPPIAKAPRYTSNSREPIVVVGQALRLPGDITSPQSLWKALIDKRLDIMTPTPEDRWDDTSFKEDTSCRITFDKSGFIDIASFDNTFFGIPAAEALFISPTTRLTLESAFEALENANIPVSKVKGTDMGVFVAAGLDQSYGELVFLDKGYDAFSRYYGTGIATSTACGRLSYLLDIHGPSLTVETACSGGLVALDQAVTYIESGRGESAIVCGVNTHTFPGMFGFLSAQKMTSTQSRCATFTNEADGYVGSEGVVSIIVKTQTAALRDGDTILGIIKSTGTMHNGRTQGLVAPSTKAQAMLQRSLLERASLEPGDIDFVEAHGTGTRLGDLIEIQGINEVFQASHTPPRPLLIGAAKSCVGHTETSSGLVGLVKALTSFSKNAVPGLTHLTEANMSSEIDLSVVPMHIPCHTAKLKPRLDEPYRALVVAYGFAGTISGVALEAPPRSQSQSPLSVDVSSPLLFVVSAKTQLALLAYIRAYLDFCREAPETSFRSICYTSCVGREYYRSRFACTVKNMKELISKLKERLSFGTRSTSHISNPRVVLGFPGQGSQFTGMAKDLAARYSGFRSILTEYAGLAGLLSGYPVLSLLLGTPDCEEDIDQSQVAQICIFVYQCAMSNWLQSLGVHAQGVMGHSLGEISAAVCAGALDFADGLRLVITRASALKADPSHPGSMAAIAAIEPVLQQYIKSLDVTNQAVIAVFNGKESHVISGPATTVESICNAVKQDGIRCVKLKVDQGFHSSCIEKGLSSLLEWLEDSESIFKPLRVPFFSTVLADKVPSDQYLRPGYWIEHARKPVKFLQTAIKLGNDKSLNVVLDVGPQPTIWTSMQSLELADKVLLATTAKQGKDQESALLQAIAGLFEIGVVTDFCRLYEERDETFGKIAIPTYPFQRQRHYPSFIPSRRAIPGHMQPPQSSASTIELVSVDSPLLELLRDHRIEDRQVLPGIAFADFLARLSSNKFRHVDCVRFHQPLVLESTGILVEATFAQDGSFVIYQNGSSAEKDRICSGSFVPPHAPYSSQAVMSDTPPIRVVKREQVYAPFKNNIHFGPTFRNVTQFTMWSDHVDAMISVPPSSYPQLDRIRKLDPCLHMFGALPQFHDLPDSMHADGFFLPTSLEGFMLHTEDLPSEFVCRYFLPFTYTHNYRHISIVFEARSFSGELLLSCKKYSVAWLPKGIAIQAPISSAGPSNWLRNTWKEEEIGSQALLQQPVQQEIVAYFGNTLNVNLLAPFATEASEAMFVQLSESERRYQYISPVNVEEIDNSLKNAAQDVENQLFGKNISIILDVTSYSSPGSDSFAALWKHVLWLMKLTMSGKMRVSSFAVVSCLSSATGGKHAVTAPPGAGTVIQGILRVYRRESGLTQNTVWGLDLPKDLSPSEISKILQSELAIRRTDGEICSSMVAYRRKPASDAVVRFVPILSPIASEAAKPASLSGVTVIIGMGSIGYALAPHIAKAGCSTVVFIGRRQTGDPLVTQDLTRLKLRSSGTFDYVQSDVSHFPSIHQALSDIQARYGPIKNVIHTAGLVSDATINAVRHQDFERVLRPKAIGAWNLHLASQELELNLDMFVMLSSISVPLGNPGQAAYVGANSFLDSLAAYRQGIGLRGLSLQLGAWESRMIEGLDLSRTMVLAMSHEEGMPLIMKALSCADPVQVIANLDVEKLAQNPIISGDPMYHEVLFSNSMKHRRLSPAKAMYTKVEAKQKIVEILRRLLELGAGEELDLNEPVTSCGIDSIAFAQARGHVLKAIGVDIPMLYLSDAYSMSDMISHACKDMADS